MKYETLMWSREHNNVFFKYSLRGCYFLYGSRPFFIFMPSYDQFLETKQKTHIISGFDVVDEDLNPLLFPFQKFCVKRALKAGKYAFFEDCGLGKTIQQLEWAYQVCKYTGGKVLILCPLAVRGQTILEAKKFNIPLDSIDINNYEQTDNIDCSKYKGVVLDESSILKNFEGATKQFQKFTKLLLWTGLV